MNYLSFRISAVLFEGWEEHNCDVSLMTHLKIYSNNSYNKKSFHYVL